MSDDNAPAVPQTLTLGEPTTTAQPEQVAVLFPPTPAHPNGPVVIFPSLEQANQHAPSVWQQLLAETPREQ